MSDPPPPPWPRRGRALRALRELDGIDQAVYRAIAATPSPTLDVGLGRLSSAADHSKLWMALAGVVALPGGRSRRAAVSGVAYSRVHTGVHYPADTIIGALIGAASAAAVRYAARWTKGRTPEQVLGEAKLWQKRR